MSAGRLRLVPALAGAVAALAGCGGARSDRPATGHRALGPGHPVSAAPRPDHALPGMDLGAVVPRPVVLRDRPNGRPVARVGARTEFGSPVTLAVVRRRPGWLGVLAPQLADGQVGWVAERAVGLVSEPVRVKVDLARRTLIVVRRHRVLLRMTVGVGAPATPTPPGRYAITDSLAEPPGSPYGCCVLALSGHQPHLRENWDGGDRLAIHGTTSPASIGQAASGGCLRASEADLRRLLHLTPLGTRVEISA